MCIIIIIIIIVKINQSFDKDDSVDENVKPYPSDDVAMTRPAEITCWSIQLLLLLMTGSGT